MSSDDPRIGSVFGNFRLLRKLGEGGMGVVYEAEHHTIGRRAAVKVMHAEFAKNDEYAKRFLNEARAVNIIRHPGLVEIFEFGQELDGSLYIVMEFLEGKSLYHRYIEPGVRPTAIEAARIGEQAARALAAAHEKHVIHRDLKPENLMLVPDPVRPTEDRVKILDFGIAKMARRSAPAVPTEPEAGKRGVRTGAGSYLGTPLYMAPEQHGRAEDVDGKADVFSFALVLYELLSGKLPYETNSLALIVKAPTPLHELSKAVPLKLSLLIQQMMALDPAQRPTMEAVATELGLIVKESRRRRSPALMAVAGAAGVIVLALAGLGIWRVVHVPTLSESREQALKVIVSGLSAGDPTERSLALRALELSRDSGIGTMAQPLLQDGQPTVQAAAAKTIGELGVVALEPDLLTTLEKSASPKTTIEVASALGKLSNPRGPETLRTLLSQSDELTKLESALRLAEQGDTGAMALLQKATQGEPQPAMLAPLLSLARGGDSQAAGKLRQLFDGKIAASEKAKLAYQLARLGDAGARDWLDRTAQTDGPDQLKAVRFLAQLGDVSGQGLLEKSSSDDKQPDTTREVAVEGLADCGKSEDASRLALLLKERNISKRLRYTTAGAILLLATGNQAPPEELSLSWAKSALGSGSDSTRELAVLLLGDESSGSSMDALRKALEDRSVNVRKRAVAALADRGGKEALSALSSGLSDSDKDVRVAAAQAIGKVSSDLIRRGESEAPKQAVDSVRKLLQSSDERERVAASGALLNMGDRSQAATMRSGIVSADAVVRRQAVELSDSDDELLFKALEDSDSKVRFAAAKKLAQKGNKKAIPVLREVAVSSELDAVAAYGLLSKLGEEAEPPPSSVLLGASVSERHAVLGTLTDLPARAAKKLLPSLTTDPSAVVRRRAAEVAFGLYQRTKDAAFLPSLRVLRNDSDVIVRSRASQLLTELSRQNPQVLMEKPASDKPSVEKTTADKPPVEKVPSVTPDAGSTQTPAQPENPDTKDPQDPKGAKDPQSVVGLVQLVGDEGLRFQVDKGAPQLVSDKPISLSLGKHRITSVGGGQDVQVSAGQTVTVKLLGTLTEQLVHDASDAIRQKDLARAQTLIDKARRVGMRMGARPQLLSELVFLQARLYDARGQWREAMNEYGKYLSLPPSQQRAETTQAVRSFVAKLAPRMGRIQIFTLKDGKCKLTEEYFLPPGEHLISLGGGKSKVMSIYAGVTTPVRQCP